MATPGGRFAAALDENYHESGRGRTHRQSARPDGGTKLRRYTGQRPPDASGSRAGAGPCCGSGDRGFCDACRTTLHTTPTQRRNSVLVRPACSGGTQGRLRSIVQRLKRRRPAIQPACTSHGNRRVSIDQRGRNPYRSPSCVCTTSVSPASTGGAVIALPSVFIRAMNVPSSRDRKCTKPW